jgi:hypothetical protein
MLGNAALFLSGALQHAGVAIGPLREPVMGTAIEVVALLNRFAPLIILNHGNYLSAFKPEGLQAAAYASLQLSVSGVQPFWSDALTSAPAARRCLTIAVLPSEAAMRRTVFPV